MALSLRLTLRLDSNPSSSPSPSYMNILSNAYASLDIFRQMQTMKQTSFLARKNGIDK